MNERRRAAFEKARGDAGWLSSGWQRFLHGYKQLYFREGGKGGRGMGWWTEWLVRVAAFWPRQLDFAVRLWDFWVHQSYRERLPSAGGRGLPRMQGHSPMALTLPLILLYFVFYGPTAGYWSGYDLWAKVLFGLFAASCALIWASQLHQMSTAFRRGPATGGWLWLSKAPLVLLLLFFLTNYWRGWTVLLSFVGCALLLWWVSVRASSQDRQEARGRANPRRPVALLPIGALLGVVVWLLAGKM